MGRANAVHFEPWPKRWQTIMNDKERQELVRVYSTWEDTALVVALTSARGQYRPEVLVLIEAELGRRGLPVPVAVENAPQPARARKRLSWIKKGYIVICIWIILPVVPMLVTAPLEHAFGWEWNEGNSPVYAFALLMFVTVPTGLLAIAVLTIAALVAKWRAKREQDHNGQQPPP